MTSAGMIVKVGSRRLAGPLLLAACFLSSIGCSGSTGKADSGSDASTDTGLDCGQVQRPRLIAPLSTGMDSSLLPVLRWEGDGETDYVLELSGSYTFGEIEYSWTGQGTKHEVEQVLERGNHYWRVYAAGCEEETVTPVWEFFAGMTPHDVNGDGYSDILVGTDGSENVKVFFGSAVASGNITSENPDVLMASGGEYLGESCASYGDMNGDGLSEAVIGAFGACPRGSVIVCAGRPEWPSAIGLDSCSRIDNVEEPLCIGFGVGLSGSADVDLDGIFDFIGSYATDSANEEYSGTAWLFLSGQGDILARTTTDDADVRVMGAVYWQALSSDTFSEDTNGDGFPEVVFTSSRMPHVGVDWVGEAYMLLGERDLSDNYTTNDLDVVFSSQEADVGFWSGDALGDFNGDGYGDIALGYRAGPGEHWIAVVGGQEEMPPEVGFDDSSVLTRIMHPGGDAIDGYLIGIMGPGDLNGDGLDDLVYTLYGSDSASPEAFDPLGAVYVVYGSADSPTEMTADDADVTILGNGDPWFAYSWGPAGDVNGDGYADFAVSATGDGPNTGDEFPGRVFVFFGGPTLEDKVTADDADLIISSTTPNESFGFCVNEDRGF